MWKNITYNCFIDNNFSDVLNKFAQKVKLKEYTEKIPYDTWKKLVKLKDVLVGYGEGSIINIKNFENETLYSDDIYNNGFGRFFNDYYIK